MPCGSKPQNGPAIYKGLLQAGATQIQAVGIMANMWFESRWDPQCSAIDSNGLPSVGLVNWNNNPTAAGLLTGNDSTDILSQIQYLISSGGLQAAGNGNDAGQAAANFAHQYERCAACGYQGGSGQLTSRAAYAQTLLPIAQSGQWGKIPQGSGTSTGGAIDTSFTSGGNSSDCVAPLNFKLPVIGGPSFCIWYKGWSRAFLGGVLITAGGITLLAGLAMLIGSEAISGVSRVPGAAGAVGKVTTALGAVGK